MNLEAIDSVRRSLCCSSNAEACPDCNIGLLVVQFRAQGNCAIALKRFTSNDPIGLFDGVNVYQYAPNPISWIDPFGLSAATDLPRMKGRSVPRVGSVLNDAGFAKTKDNGVNETWKHADGSHDRVHK